MKKLQIEEMKKRNKIKEEE